VPVPSAPAVPAVQPPKAPEIDSGSTDGADTSSTADGDDKTPGEAHRNREQVQIGESVHVTPDQTVEDVVVVFGDANIEGKVEGDVVVIGGLLTVSGTVTGDCVNVGRGVKLDATAHVQGDVVGILGGVARSVGAQVDGKVVPVHIMNIGPELPAWISQTWNECILKLRPVAFSARWTVGAALIFLLLYGLIALIFPEAVEKSARQFSERGIASLFVGILALPCAAIFLLIVLLTFVFAPLVPLLMAPLFFGAMIGKAGLLRRMGVGLLRPVAADVPAPVSVLAGGLVLALVYTIPVVGLFAWALTWTWGFGAFVQSVFRRNRPVTDSVPPQAAPGASGPQKPKPTGTSPSPLPSQPLPSASSSGITLATATELAGQTGSEPPGAVASVQLPSPVIAPSATTTSSLTPQAGESGNLVVSSSGSSIPISGTPVATPISSSLALSVVLPTDPVPRMDGPISDPLSASSNPGPAPGVSASGFTPPPPSASSAAKSPSTSTFDSTGGTASIPGVRPPELSPSELLQLPRVALVPRLAPLAFDWIILTLLIHGPIFDFDRFQWICRLIEFSYFAGFYYWRGATPMGLIFGLRVVRLDGRPLDFPTMAVRGVAAAFGAMAAGIGYFWCAWDPEKQTWHDKLAGTVVVKTSKSATLV
jgi:uncharacterized RDD family membrane protein YckC